MYEQTISALKEFKTITAHITNLGKISLETEDSQLKQLLTAVIIDLQRLHSDPSFKAKSTPRDLIDATGYNFKQLKDYCSQFTSVKKSEWQVLAERYGWTPPKE